MKRMKTFFIYALLVFGFWLVSDIIMYISIKGTYKPIKTDIYISEPKVIVSESKATYVNGCVKGIIKNNTDEIMNNKYLKIDMYSERNVNLGTKYVKIDNLQFGEVDEFEMWYEFTDVEYVIIRITDEAPTITGDEFSSHYIRFGLLFGRLLLMYFM